jgi:hypothetical protein
MDPAHHHPRLAIRFFTGSLGNGEATTASKHLGFH